MAFYEKKLTLKLMVDKAKQRVVFAEADNYFVDILFSFLTLPLGTISRVLNKSSLIGSIDELYKSVEMLDVKDLQTDACKTMLLRPRSEAATLCEDLKLNIDDTNPRKAYLCGNSDCWSNNDMFYSCGESVLCLYCKQKMDVVRMWPKYNAGLYTEDGVFVKGKMMFLITDDLLVKPASLQCSINLISKIGIEDEAILEEMFLELGNKEVLNLLQRFLVSKMPLTDIVFKDVAAMEMESNFDPQELIQVKAEGDTDKDSKELRMKLFVNKSNNKVLCAEAEEDVADILLSFLTLPLGSIVKVLDNNIVFGCLKSLYKSVEDLSLDYFKSEECKSMLLSPKLAPFFACNSNTLDISEAPKRSRTRYAWCDNYYTNDRKCREGRCVHERQHRAFFQLNPKEVSYNIRTGKRYAKGKFLVWNNLLVSPFSVFDMREKIKREELPFNNLAEREITLGKTEVLDLLRAALTSKSPLYVFHSILK